VSGIGGSLLGGAFGEEEKKKKKKKDKYDDDGSYTQSYSEEGHHRKQSGHDSERYGQAHYEATQYPSGGRREEYSRYEQDERGGTYGYQQSVETSSYGGGGYELHEERRYETSDQWQTEDRREGFDSQGEYYNKEKKYVYQSWSLLHPLTLRYQEARKEGQVRPQVRRRRLRRRL
jgi:hypothetical protein